MYYSTAPPEQGTSLLKRRRYQPKYVSVVTRTGSLWLVTAE